MKMVMAIVPRKRGDDVLTALVNAGYASTFSETRGGMLRQSQLTLFTGVRNEEVPKVLEIIRESCSSELAIHYGFGLDASGEQSPGVRMPSGAVVFVWSLDRFELP